MILALAIPVIWLLFVLINLVQRAGTLALGARKFLFGGAAVAASSRGNGPLARILLALAGGVLLAACFAGCDTPALERQARVADAIARAGNRALPALVAAYQDEGDAAIAAAPNRPAAERALAAVAERWRPVWGECGLEARPGCTGAAWAAFRRVHALWANAIDRARAPDAGGAAPQLAALAGDMRDAWCALSRALPARVQLPAVDALVCPSTPAADGGAPHVQH